MIEYVQCSATAVKERRKCNYLKFHVTILHKIAVDFFYFLFFFFFFFLKKKRISVRLEFS